jgi:hypothetical protein
MNANGHGCEGVCQTGVAICHPPLQGYVQIVHTLLFQRNLKTIPNLRVAAMRWSVAFSGINEWSWLFNPPSPRPSPPRRGRIVRRRDALSNHHVIRPLHVSENSSAATDSRLGDKSATRNCHSLSSGERARVRASVHLTSSGNARRELEKKSGRKVVTNENYLGLTQLAKKMR